MALLKDECKTFYCDLGDFFMVAILCLDDGRTHAYLDLWSKWSKWQVGHAGTIW